MDRKQMTEGAVDHSDPKQLSLWMARAIAYLAYAYLMITQIILIQGFLLKLFGANTGSSYVDWAYRSLERSMAPFRGMFETITLEGNSVLDTSILFAMVIYGILALVVNSLLDWLTYRLGRVQRARALEEAQDAAAAAEAYNAGYSTGGVEQAPPAAAGAPESSV